MDILSLIYGMQILFSLIFILIILGLVIFILWMLYDAWKYRPYTDSIIDRYFWVGVIFFTGILGAIVYYFWQFRTEGRSVYPAHNNQAKHQYRLNSRGQITINNGSGHDATAILTSTHSNQPISQTYIASGTSANIHGIIDGNYYLYFAFQDGNSIIGRFRFEDVFTFSSMRTSAGFQYSRFTVTLHPVSGGTAHTLSINESQFPNF